MSFGPKSANTFNQAPPANYVAGAGRGATGFTTRSDIGPARPAVPAADAQFGQAPAGYVAGMGRGMGDLARVQAGEADNDRGDYSESNYDSFAGYGERLFASGAYEEDDREADQIYDQVDEFMDGRHKRRRELNMLEEEKKRKSNRPKISDQFSDLKRELATVTSEEWDSIPEVGDHSLKLKQKSRKEIYTPLPDYMLDNSSSQLAQSVSSGLETPSSGFASGVRTTSGLAEARGIVLTSKLDKMSDSVSGQTVVDPRGYLTDLSSLKVNSSAEIGDIKKARALLSSVTTTNPKHGPGWIAAARVEEVAGKLVGARKLIRQGCEACPDSEDVWLEAARLHTTDNAKAILANAVHHLPNSVKIWLEAANLESNENQKKIVLRRALEFIPNSVKLWKTAIDLESVADARIMLGRAVECVPQSAEMWLALAKLETHENARRVLNQAREAIPTDPSPWITAAKLEEAHNNGHLVNKIIEKMMVSLSQYDVVISREQWLKEAEAAESASSPLTAAAIVTNTIHLGVDDEDRLATWTDDAETVLSHDPPSVHVARAIYSHARTIFPNKKSLWLASAVLEKDHGTPDSLNNMLKEAVKHCPKAEILWLMAAKETWLAGNVPGARSILVEAFDANPESEQIWLAAIKLEWENNEFQRARKLLERARERAPNPRVWLKSALLERELKDLPQALKLLDEGIAKFPTYAKYYMMAAQICCVSDDPYFASLKEQDLSFPPDIGRARDYLQKGLTACPDNPILWKLAIRLEETARGSNKARSMADLARLRLPKSDLIWLELIRLEKRAGNEKLAESNMAKALKDCPTSGILWAEEIETCAKPLQKQRCADGLKKCDNDPIVVTAVAKLFGKDGNIAKARKWFDRAVKLDPKFGDAWAHWYAFELAAAKQGKVTSSSTSNEAVNADSAHNGGGLSPESILHECVTASPNKGELWCSIAKQTQIRRLDLPTIFKKVVEHILSS